MFPLHNNSFPFAVAKESIMMLTYVGKVFDLI